MPQKEKRKENHQKLIHQNIALPQQTPRDLISRLQVINFSPAPHVIKEGQVRERGTPSYMQGGRRTLPG